MPEPMDWKGMTWARIKTKYSEMISYHLYPDFHKYQEDLRTHPPIVKALETKQYDLFVDVGTYIGLFTIVGAYNCKRVIAYEASPFVYGILLYNTQFNKNIDCRYKWVGNKNSVPRSNGGLYMIHEDDIKEYNIEVVDLDSELLPLLNLYNNILIKMDMEGNEYEALKGCSLLLPYIKIHWIIEVHDIPSKNLDQKDILKYFEKREIEVLGTNFFYIKGVKK